MAEAGRIYAVTFRNIAITAAQDLFMIAPATNKPVLIHGFTLSNVGGTADAGDAQEELLMWEVIRGLATVGSGGAAATVKPLRENDTAASFTARVNDTTVAVVGAGTTDYLHEDAWNVRIPERLFLTPELRWPCSAAATRLVIRLTNAPADSLAVSGTCWVEELI